MACDVRKFGIAWKSSDRGGKTPAKKIGVLTGCRLVDNI
jgi:hypothetical protein